MLFLLLLTSACSFIGAAVEMPLTHNQNRLTAIQHINICNGPCLTLLRGKALKNIFFGLAPADQKKYYTVLSLEQRIEILEEASIEQAEWLIASHQEKEWQTIQMMAPDNQEDWEQQTLLSRLAQARKDANSDQAFDICFTGVGLLCLNLYCGFSYLCYTLLIKKHEQHKKADYCIKPMRSDHE